MIHAAPALFDAHRKSCRRPFAGQINPLKLRERTIVVLMMLLTCLSQGGNAAGACRVVMPVDTGWNCAQGDLKETPAPPIEIEAPPQTRVLATSSGKTSAPQVQTVPESARLPTLFIIGDSTVKNHTKGLQGWGDPIAACFDKAKIRVENRALGGRSSRTFLTEGLWEKVLADVKRGDFILMQFGHNDGGSLTQSRARASLKGNGDETQEITDAQTCKKESVHTFGWYMRKYAADSIAKGAIPIVCSLVPRNIWKDDHTVARASNDYGKWAAEAAASEGAYFINLNELIAKRYEEVGMEKVKALYFPADHTHTSPAGAQLNAEMVITGLKSLKDCSLKDFLLPAEALNKPAPPK